MYREFNPQFFITPMISLHHDELYLYGKQEWINDRPERNKNSLNNLFDNSNHNKLSIPAKRKAKKAIKYLLYSANEKKVFNPKFGTSFKFKVGFITLTLPSQQRHTDKEIKSLLLNQFLIEAKKKWSMVNYVWKAEKQGNGNIHFHILTDKFIPHWELRQCWNRICNKLGYVDEFQKIHKKKNPNSTDIHSLYKIKSVYSYITKYMTKPEHRNKSKVSAKDINYTMRKLGGFISVSSGAKKFLGKLSGSGRIWACSTTLSNITGAREELSEELLKEVEVIEKNQRTKRVNKDYVSCIYFDKGLINPATTPLLYKMLTDYLQQFFNDKNQSIVYPPLPPE